MAESMIQAWRYIFNHHPHGDKIMDAVMDQDKRITFHQFELWYQEARNNG
jgi:hypothetical protein